MKDKIFNKTSTVVAKYRYTKNECHNGLTNNYCNQIIINNQVISSNTELVALITKNIEKELSKKIAELNTSDVL